MRGNPISGDWRLNLKHQKTEYSTELVSVRRESSRRREYRGRDQYGGPGPAVRWAADDPQDMFRRISEQGRRMGE